jgi:glycosyltransferase involved in cell wall biosynthesis
VARAFSEAGVVSELLEVIYNPVDVTDFVQTQADSGRALRTALSISQDAFVVGLVGQIQSIKGQEELIRAAAQVVKAVPNAQFVIVGGAFGETAQSLLRHLKDLVQRLQLDECVHFVGFRNDIPAVMRALDVLTVPSQPEISDFRDQQNRVGATQQQCTRPRQIGFGRVIIEGMAAGCSVVATQLDGILEILEPGHNGLLVPAGDVDALADAIILLARDPKLCDRLAGGGLQTVQRFTPERHADQVQELYDAVLKRAKIKLDENSYLS